MVAAAVIAVGAVTAGATAYAGSESAGATKSATNASIAAQEQAQTAQQKLNAPYAGIGTGTPGTGSAPGTTGAITQYQNLLGLGPQGAAGMEQTLAATPGYQFAKTQGLGATENSASAAGLGLSGNTLQALDKFSTGLADSTYQEAVGNAQNAVTIGQNAAAGTGSGILQTGANVGSTISAAGNTLAGIDANTVAGISKSIGNAGNQYITNQTLQGLQNPGTTAAPGASQDYTPAGEAQTPAWGSYVPQ